VTDGTLDRWLVASPRWPRCAQSCDASREISSASSR